MISIKKIEEFKKTDLKDFQNYISEKRILDNKTKTLFLPSGHFYFDLEELKETQVIINPRIVKSTDEMVGLMDSISMVLKRDGVICGRFIQTYKIWSIFKKRNFFKFLESYGFEILDLTEIKEITYFYAKKNDK
jgi:hypothetical protein